jgi:cytochrome P450
MQRQMVTRQTLYEQVLDYANRANPYPLYAQLRQTPVARQQDGSYVVSTYHEIVALFHDPRISSDQCKRPRGELSTEPESKSISPAQQAVTEVAEPEECRGDPAIRPPFIRTDPPEHDCLRRQATWPFGPPHTPGRVASLEPDLVCLANRQIDAMRGKTRIDIVDDFAFPIPVTVISELLGVPPEDAPRFHEWADAIVAGIDFDPGESPQARQARLARADQARAELRQFCATLIERDRQNPDLLSGLVTEHGPDGPMAPADIAATGGLLLVAGHETTVNMISNGMLTLLRHPDVLDRLWREPEMVIRLVEELLRYEPPVQMLASRTALADIPIAGTTIPCGSVVILLLASGSRDPARFGEPERFDPDRQDNEHLGFGSGIHYCYGAPLARLETQTALTALAQRLENPRLVEDPPPYRESATLRGPRHLFVEIDGVRDDAWNAPINAAG